MGLSTHILDTALGRPAANVDVILSWFRDDAAGGAWEEIGRGQTDADGRCKTLLGDRPFPPVSYKLHFATSAYFRTQHIDCLYPYVEIVFTVSDPTQHYHIPLLLTANGYTTYRGS
jgi:5-hydroxyisourate hydrolase